MRQAFNDVLNALASQLEALPDAEKSLFIESLSTLLLRTFLPMSGMTVQQHVEADAALLQRLNDVMAKEPHEINVFNNSSQPCYVYQFAREATSAGILPVYRDKKTGHFFIALVCNKRNLTTYTWSAGYSEAPLPIWSEELLLEKAAALRYNREPILASAKKTVLKQLAEKAGDWTKLDYHHQPFSAGFHADGVTLPTIDINSFHTAKRELLEEINLNIDDFPQHKKYLIWYDNTLGISQADAPGQLSNRSHQYLVYLGTLEEPPAIHPGSDVAQVDWINVATIQRSSATDYVARGKPLCLYILRGVEIGLKQLWNELLLDTSQQRFSTPANVAAEIKHFCTTHNIAFTHTEIQAFLNVISGDLPDKTYTGQLAHKSLTQLLAITHYLKQPHPPTFLRDIMRLLTN